MSKHNDILVAAHNAIISDTEARRIASEWHGGGGTALYAFASTGAINTARADHNIAEEITECARGIRGKGGPEFTELIELRTYTKRQGKRGPVEGWNNLTWEPEAQQMTDCPDCWGVGELMAFVTCPTCKGTGYVPEES